MVELGKAIVQTFGPAGLALAVYWKSTEERLSDLRETIAALRSELADEKAENAEEQKFRRDVIERAIQRKSGANGRTDS